MFSKVITGESVNNVQATFAAKDGRPVLVEGNASGYHVNGELVATQGIFRDITEHKRADEELKLRAQILDGATDAIFVHDADDNFIYVNEAACRTHGYSREEFLKMKSPQLVDPERSRQSTYVKMVP
jgi:PAS domain-containing protein